MSRLPTPSSDHRLHGRFVASVPDPDQCKGTADIGKFNYDEDLDIWHECVIGAL